MEQLYKLSLAFYLFLLSSVVFAQQPQIKFTKLEHNYGSIKESDGAKTATFEFTNEGSVPLILNDVKASCGCTTPKWTREPVPPKGKGQVDVSYDPQGRPGPFNKSVMVISNASNGTTVLRVLGQVEEGEKTITQLYPREVGSLRVKSNHMSFARMTTDEVKTQDLELVNDTDKPVNIGFRRVPDHLKVKVVPETIPAKGKGTLTVTYDAKGANTFGFASHRIYLSLDGSNDYRASVGVSATIEEDFSKLSTEELEKAPVAVFSESAYDFGNLRQGEKKDYTFTLTNKGKSDLIIRNVRSSCGCTAVAPSKSVISPGESAPIKVTFDSSGKRGRQSKSITVITNDPKSPTNILRVSCNIET